MFVSCFSINFNFIQIEEYYRSDYLIEEFNIILLNTIIEFSKHYLIEPI